MSVYEEFCKLPDLNREWANPGDTVATYFEQHDTVNIRENTIVSYAPLENERVIGRPAPFEDVAGTVLVDRIGRVVAVRNPSIARTNPWVCLGVAVAYNETYDTVLDLYNRDGWQVLFNPNS